MAKRADLASPELESDLAPEDSLPPVDDDGVPRLTADDGQGAPAAPADEFDDPSLHSGLKPDDDEGDYADGATEAEAEAPAEEPEATTPAATPAQPTTQGGLSDEDRYYLELGRRAAAQAAAANQPRQPAAQPAAIEESEEEIDPEVEKLARRTAKILRGEMEQQNKQVAEIVQEFHGARRRAVMAEDSNVAKTTLETFLKQNALTKGDQDAADLVRDEVQEAIDQHFAAAAAGHNVGRVDPNKIIELAQKKAARLQKAFANRAVRQTQERSKVVSATRSTAGGSTPQASRPVVKKTETDRRKDLERTLHGMGFR